tara:strand:+ start:1034 stop:1870 length:837 start_codon:yes stop_codon:yes gene_type:complete
MHNIISINSNITIISNILSKFILYYTMRKIKKKMNKIINLDKINKTLILIIFAFYVFIGVYIQISRPQYNETFINLDYDITDIKSNLINTLKRYRTKSNTVSEEVEEQIYEEDNDYEDESYIIEQIRSNEKKMDNYYIRAPNRNLKFITSGVWEINKKYLKIISIHGGQLVISQIDNNMYKFELEDYKVKIIYKKKNIIAKIEINNKDNFYLKKYNRNINFYDEYNNRVADGKYFKSEPKDEKMINFYKLIFDKKYNNYKQIFLITYILYLQMSKFLE